MAYTEDKYKLVELEVNGVERIGLVLLDERFKNATFVYGAVSFTEGGDTATMHYAYDIIDGEIQEEHLADFEAEVGKLLVSLIEYGLKNESLIYKGGVDE